MEKQNYNYQAFKYPRIRDRSFKEFWYHVFKRFFDIVISFILIVLSLLPLLIVGIIIAIADKAFPLYFDKRVGYKGKILNVIKFRSMVTDAESNIDKYLTEEQKAKWEEERKLDDDPRTTRVGQFIRKSSIDELPQLINIFIGNMTFVGPRPITERELFANFTAEEAYRMLSKKPGATGNWQVFGRETNCWANGERKKLVLEYVDDANFWMDAKIFLLTVPSMFKYFAEETIKKTRLRQLHKNKEID